MDTARDTPVDTRVRLRDRAALVAGRPLVLDGGLSTQLEALGHRLDDALWSARLLDDAPDDVLAVHAAFLAAGADIVTTVGYQLAARSLRASGRDPSRADALTRRSVELARRAVTDHLGDPAHDAVTDHLGDPAHDAVTDHLGDPAHDAAADQLGGRGRVDGPPPTSGAPAGGGRPSVAASIGAYGALLADGSEYRGGYDVTEGALVDVHAPRVAAAVAAGVDVLACETIPSGTEVAAFARVLAEVEVPAWVSVTLGPDGCTTPEGQPLADALAPAAAIPTIVAIGVNCVPPELVTPALETLSVLGVPGVVYPNVGDRYDAELHAWVPRDRDDARGATAAADLDVAGWITAGAVVLGGCCGTTPDDIARLGETLAAAARG
jgi:homocysteine S-methyltransferase